MHGLFRDAYSGISKVVVASLGCLHIFLFTLSLRLKRGHFFFFLALGFTARQRLSLRFYWFLGRGCSPAISRTQPLIPKGTSLLLTKKRLTEALANLSVCYKIKTVPTSKLTKSFWQGQSTAATPNFSFTWTCWTRSLKQAIIRLTTCLLRGGQSSENVTLRYWSTF